MLLFRLVGKLEGEYEWEEVEMFRASRLGPVVLLLMGTLRVGAQDDRAHQVASHALSQTAVNCGDVAVLADCHPAMPTGCTNSLHPRYDAYLNFLKNQQPGRDLVPSHALGVDEFISLEDKIPAGIGRTHHAQFADQLADFGEGNIHAVVGVLYFVENTAITSQHRGETCNCQLRQNDSFDFHLGIGFDSALAQKIRNSPSVHDPKHPGLAEQTSVVAEMTPHTRDAKWTVARLNRQRGKQVKVIGQLLLDNVHANLNDDCEFSDEAGGSCWRASAWEIHPVTQFLVCKAGKTCGSDSPDSDWTRLEDLP